MAKKKSTRSRSTRAAAQANSDEMQELLAEGPDEAVLGGLELPIEVAYPLARSILAEHGDQLKELPGVRSLDVGLKMQGTELRPTVAIRVHVDSKRSLKELKSTERIPPFFHGIATDVQAAGPLEELADEYLEGGDRVYREQMPHRSGTVSLVVRSVHPSTFGRPRLLTCAHVASGGEHPGIIDSADRMVRVEEPPYAGRALRNHPAVGLRSWAYDAYHDCALITPDRESLPGVFGYGRVSTIRRVTERDWGRTVIKVGRKTGITSGRLITHASSALPLPDGSMTANHLEIMPEDGVFAAGGDSGAPIILDGALIGILRAVAPNGIAVAMRATYAARTLRFVLA